MSLDVRLSKVEKSGVYSANITHNLGRMAAEAGLYYPLWRPDEINALYAREIVPFLERGLQRLMNDPERYKKLSAENGWGIYEHLIDFVQEYLAACKENPDAEIEVSR